MIPPVIIMFCFFLGIMLRVNNGVVSAEHHREYGATVAVTQDTIGSSSANDSLRELRRIVVRASARKPLRLLGVKGTNVFRGEDVQITAGAAGDICRYIATLPSVVSSLGENFDNALYVRGGRPSEVLFVVDGMEFENINHFSKANGSGGPVGFINSDYVKNVTFHAGNTPVSYPSRLSSVIGIDMKNGSFTDRKYSLGGKLTGGMAAAEGPLGNDKGAYLVSARYIDFGSLKKFLGDYGIPRLGDIIAKGTLLTGGNTDVTATALLAYNDYLFDYPIKERDDISGKAYGNTLTECNRILQGGMSVQIHTRTDRLKHEITTSLSFRRGMLTDSLNDFKSSFFRNRYHDNPVRVDTDNRYRGLVSLNSIYQLNDTITMQYGARILGKRHTFHTGDQQYYEGTYVSCNNGTPVEIIRSKEGKCRLMNLDGGEIGGHGEITLNNGNMMGVVGLRTDYYHLLREVTFSPRLTAGMKFAESASLTFGASVQHQFPTEMPTQFFYFFSLFGDMDNRSTTKSTKTFLEAMKPLRCYQTVLTYEHTVLKWLHMRSDGYFKWYDQEYHFISPKAQDVLRLDDNEHWQLKKQDGKRKAYGIEVLIDNPEPHRFSWSLGASFFDVKNRYSDGTWYDDWTNVRFTGSLSLGVKLFSGHLLSFGMQGNGGRPYCPEIIIKDCLGRKESIYDPEQEYYSGRLDRYITAHVRYGIQHKIGILSTELSMEVLNLFNNQPTLEYRFNGDSYYDVKPFGIVPVLGLKVKW